MLLAVAVALVFMAISLRLIENRLIFFPPKFPQGFADPAVYGLEAEEVWLTASDGVRLNAFFVAAPDSRRVMLLLHGNAENIGYGLPRLKEFSALGLNLFALDYRGYGKSEGSPDEAGVYRDADAAYRYLVEEGGFRGEDVILYGNSLGGAVAVDLAARQPCGALILESTFTNAPEMARRMFFLPLFQYIPRSRFDSLRKISSVRAPVLIIHGTRDEVVPFAMGERLFEAAPEPKRFLRVEGAGHNDVLAVAGEKYLEAMRSVLGRKDEE
jgi:hypothetical protein